MTARMYYDNDADPAALEGQTVAIIGYGSQGHAHALNLHESGVDVVVGLAPGSKSRDLAAEAGLRVSDVADAVKEADVIMILVPDTAQKAVYDEEIAPHLHAGHLVMFAHGFNIHFGRIVDVAPESVIVEVTGDEDKVDGLVDLLRERGVLEMVRTGKIALVRGNGNGNGNGAKGAPSH